jgi:hypothetical protein
MGHPDGAHTHGSGGFDPMRILIIIGALLVGPAVAAAVAELLHLLVLVLVALAAVVGVALVAFGAWRLRQTRQEPARALYRVTPAPPKQSPLPTGPRPAIEQRAIHLHLHGVSAEDLAAIIERHRGDQ